jgi:hypothetical protein
LQKQTCHKIPEEKRVDELTNRLAR